MSARRIVLVALLALAEACILAPIVWLVLPWDGMARAAAGIGVAWVILFGLAVLWRLLGHVGASLTAQRIALGVGLLALVIIAELAASRIIYGFAPDLLNMLPAFLAALLFWWRGMAIGQSDLKPREVEWRQQVGVLLLVVMSIVTIFTRSSDLFPSITALFFATLVALPLSNLEYTQQSAIGRSVPMSASWWAWIIAVSGLVLMAGLVFASILSGRPVTQLLVLLLTVLLFPLALLMMLIPASFFDWLAELLRRLGDMMRNAFPFDGLSEQLQTTPSNESAGIVLSPQVNFLIALIVFAAIVALALLLMSRSRRQIAMAHNLADDTTGVLADSNASAGSGAPGRRLSSAALRRWLAAMTVRRLYARATYEAAKRGFRRAPMQTPYDFLPSLQRAFPSAESDASTITDAYVAAHYGEAPDTNEALDRLRAAWERMRKTPSI
jgi:hypothetical protein